jgi:hypothetical protein
MMQQAPLTVGTRLRNKRTGAVGEIVHEPYSHGRYGGTMIVDYVDVRVTNTKGSFIRTWTLSHAEVVR